MATVGQNEREMESLVRQLFARQSDKPLACAMIAHFNRLRKENPDMTVEWARRTVVLSVREMSGALRASYIRNER